ncbi:MAG: hypothetical protein S4CHLAM7_09880 [Chlamydiae bacterium]|nr:hypothetical protein [Chlamydiota bacterium]
MSICSVSYTPHWDYYPRFLSTPLMNQCPTVADLSRKYGLNLENVSPGADHLIFRIKSVVYNLIDSIFFSSRSNYNICIDLAFIKSDAEAYLKTVIAQGGEKSCNEYLSPKASAFRSGRIAPDMHFLVKRNNDFSKNLGLLEVILDTGGSSIAPPNSISTIEVNFILSKQRLYIKCLLKKHGLNFEDNLKTVTELQKAIYYEDSVKAMDLLTHSPEMCGNVASNNTFARLLKFVVNPPYTENHMKQNITLLTHPMSMAAFSDQFDILDKLLDDNPVPFSEIYSLAKMAYFKRKNDLVKYLLKREPNFLILEKELISS